MQIEHNDRPNAELIMKSKKNADLIIKSVDLWIWIHTCNQMIDDGQFSSILL